MSTGSRTSRVYWIEKNVSCLPDRNVTAFDRFIFLTNPPQCTVAMAIHLMDEVGASDWFIPPVKSGLNGPIQLLPSKSFLFVILISFIIIVISAGIFLMIMLTHMILMNAINLILSWSFHFKLIVEIGNYDLHAIMTRAFHFYFHLITSNSVFKLHTLVKLNIRSLFPDSLRCLRKVPVWFVSQLPRTVQFSCGCAQT